MAIGGKRLNSGRKRGSGKYGHPTVPVRVPDFLVGLVDEFVQVMIKQNDQRPLDESAIREWLRSLNQQAD